MGASGYCYLRYVEFLAVIIPAVTFLAAERFAADMNSHAGPFRPAPLSLFHNANARLRFCTIRISHFMILRNGNFIFVLL